MMSHVTMWVITAKKIEMYFPDILKPCHQNIHHGSKTRDINITPNPAHGVPRDADAPPRARAIPPKKRKNTKTYPNIQ
jgi:hypothetical protein